MLAGLIRTGLSVALAPVRTRFNRVLERPARAQESVLARIATALAHTEYGRHWGITGGEDYRAFAAHVPIVEYEDLEPWVTRQMETGDTLLTPEPVVAYEETSGSSGRRKCIPYTQSLLRAFNSAFVTWAADVIAHGPRFKTGRMFFSLSPAVRTPQQTPTRVPIGLQDDTQYLTPVVRRLVGSRLVVPPGMAMALDSAAFRRVLLCRLIGATDLELISIWSPTYLLALIDLMEAERETILGALDRGIVEVAGRQIPVPRLPAKKLVQLDEPVFDWTKVWPELKLLSVWMDAGSAPFARRLAARFSGVLMQGKGLLATEAPITIPLLGADAPVPLVDRVFLEFQRDDGSITLLSDLAEHEEAAVIVSQSGGLTRYRTHDRVLVAGRYRNTPCLRFLGRDNLIADFVGEKLHAQFVEAAIQGVFGDDVFGFVVPNNRTDRLPRYICFVEQTMPGEHTMHERAFDARLCQAVHYRQARLHGQLGPVEVIVLPDLRTRYESLMLESGMTLGAIKYSAVLGQPCVTAIHNDVVAMGVRSS
jgi:hypothetical protein